MKFALLALALLASSSAFAADIGAALIAATSSKPEVSDVVAAALTASKINSQSSSAAQFVLLTAVDCTKNPRAYREVDTSMCQFQLRKSIGWYADPVMVVTVTAFVNKNAAAAGNVTSSDIMIREVSIVKPDPTGLE